MDTLYRQWLILRMIPRRGRIATTDILSRLRSSEYGIDTTLRTVQRDLLNLVDVSKFPLERDENCPAGAGARTLLPSTSPTWIQWRRSPSNFIVSPHFIQAVTVIKPDIVSTSLNRISWKLLNGQLPINHVTLFENKRTLDGIQNLL